MIRKDLSKNWRMKAQNDKEWLKTEVPCTVYGTLLENKKMENPYFRLEEYNARELLRQDYEFETNFYAENEIIQKDSVSLVFYGLDTIADIYLNDKKIGTADNMHRTWSYPVKEVIKDGENHLRIVFHSPINYMEKKMQESEDEISYIPVGCMKGNSYIRKAHCMFGWDWGPQLPDAGIFRTVELQAYDDYCLDSVKIEQIHNEDKVMLTITSDLSSSEMQEHDGYSVLTELFSPEGSKISSEETKVIYNRKSDSVNSITHMEVIHPELWWPNGYGAQPLYSVKINLCKNGEVVDSKMERIGLRTMTISTQKDQWGKEFCFQVNGIKIFSMGADYIPQDNILSRITKERTRDLLLQCVKASYNTIRVWGGGYYPEDDFYDICDELGLIVWQDLMFACNIYSMTEEFEQSIVLETIDNVKRIQNHACLGIWCGNNEIESAWAYWGWKDTHSKKLLADYIKQFEYVIPKAVKQLDQQNFFWPSSPSSGGCFDATGDENQGDVHYWDVWHGLKPFTDYKKYYFRFCSEFGFQSFPSKKTVDAYTLPEDRNIFSKVMESHQKNPDANGKILYYISATFQYPKDFKSLLYISQVLQAWAVQAGVEHWRRNRGRCMGAIYWQLNDCWPVASWASIDYYGRWKLLHYAAKKFFAPRMVSIDVEENRADFYILNETRDSYQGKLHWYLKNMKNECLLQDSIMVSSEPLSSSMVFQQEYSEWIKKEGKENLYLQVQLEVEHSIVSENTVLFEKPKYVQYLPCTYQYEVTENETEFVIHLSSDHFAQFVELDTNGFDVVFSDNFFSICGQEGVKVTVSKSEYPELTAEQLKENLTIQSVVDSYTTN